MTNEQHIENLKKLKSFHNGSYGADIDRAIKLLEQETCEDAISRQAVLATLDNMDNVLDEDRTIENYKELLKECYEVLSPVTPQPKTGYWIEKDDNLHECSECGQYIYSETEHDLLEFHAFCGRCGAKMVEPQERSE